MGMTEDEFDNMKNAAVSDAGDAYDKALEDGVPKPEAASTAIEAAGKVMIDMGATPEMVDTMRDTANKDFIEANDYAGGSSTLTPANYVIMTLAKMAPK